MKRNYDDYIKIQNHNGKVWLLPQCGLDRALLLYQPSSIRGMVLKRCLPSVLKIEIVQRIVKSILKIQDCTLEMDSRVDEIIHCVFDQGNLVYSCFLGTPSKHQKTTIQIASTNSIVGYCKVTNNKEISNLFIHEKKVLDRLDECGVKNVPRCLWCGEMEDGTAIFIQNTKKSFNSKVVQRITNLHFDFLGDLASKTKRQCKYSLTDYYMMIRCFEKNICILEEMGYEKKVFEKAIIIVEKELKNHDFFSVYHGDFTPWNTFEQGADIYAFDFEYARETYPPYLDIFHFFSQSLIFKKRMTAKKMFRAFEKEFITNTNGQIFHNIYCAYLQYLIHIMAFYIERDKEQMKKEDLHCVSIWYEIILCILDSGKV